MKNKLITGLILILISIVAIVLNCCKKVESSLTDSGLNNIKFNPTLGYGRMTDQEGNTYKTIKIGSQTWMAENLRATKYRNGEPIPNVTVNTNWAALTTGAYCWYNNAANKANYGAMYNWYAVADGRNIAPIGWHVPTEAEWSTLSDYLGGENVAGGKLKESGTGHWVSPNTGATNESGFTALSSGSHIDGFNEMGTSGNLWSSSADGTNSAWYFNLGNDNTNVNRLQGSKLNGFSIRCVKGIPVAPTISTTDASAITANAATSGGNITGDGGSSVTERGVCWATVQNPTTANSKTSDGTGTGNFTSSLTGLLPGTTYYLRAYATNSIATTYGTLVTLTTTAVSPTLTTSAASSIAPTTATSGGYITTDGGSAVTVRGVCWATSENPTTANFKTTDGTGAGTFTSNLTGLLPGSTYYLKAYATNNMGTTYGNQVTFTTTTVMATLTTTAATAVTAATATSGGDITSDGGSVVTARGVCWSIGQNPTTANSKTIDGTGAGTFTSNLTGLLPGTTYYVKAYATNSIGTTYGSQVTLTTIAVMATLTTTGATAVTAATATSGGDIATDGGSAVTGRGVCWSMAQNPTTSNSKTSDGIGTGTFISSLIGLLPGTTYYVRAYATNSIGTSYGNQLTLNTTAVTATLTTTPVSTVASITAIVGGNITTDGGSAVIARGVCWSTDQNPTTANSKTFDGTGAGSFISNLTGLLPGTTYYVKAYATNSIGTVYGNQVTLITTAVMATLKTTTATAITTASATCGGDIITDGGSVVTARGTCWSTDQNPTTSNSKTIDGTGAGTFTSNLTGLLPGTTYYVKAYATNSIGTTYGSQVTLTTIAVMATLTTTGATAVTAATATSGGDITTDGGSAVTGRGVCWSIAQNPTTSNSKTSDGTGTGTFISSLSGLLPGTTYYVKAYATNSIGTSYGNQLTLNTTAVMATLTTTPVSTVASITAIVGGNITNEGGSAVTARGICWSTDQNPTTANSKTFDGTGAGSFISNLTGLLPGTTYYVKAYATNSIGTAYGNQVTLTTTAVLATLTTTAATAITAATATSGGDITTDGGSVVTARGICWSTNQNPTTANSKTIDGTGAGTFTSNLTSLLPGATYYVKAYATNDLGTMYGNQVTLTTKAVAPVLTTVAASAIASTTATSGGNITTDGGSTVTARGVCWSIFQNPTTSNSKTTDGTGAGSFTSNITGLSHGTTYYLRAYATNSIGTSYGNVVSFAPSIVADIDGNVYHYIVIGTQTWMVENLKTTRYRNGDLIANVTDNTAWYALATGAYCWYNNDAATYKAGYGALYNWYAVADVRNIAPVGWHVPSNAEWITLTDYLGGGSVAGGKLKEAGTAHWLSPNTGAINESGFTAFPGGFRSSVGTFGNIANYGSWWSSTENTLINAWARDMGYNGSNVYSYSNYKALGLSVRCLRD